MPTSLTLKANEEGLYVINFQPFDEDDNAVTPSAVLWSLTDLDGDFINEREDVDYESDSGLGSGGALSTSMDIALNGDDLAVTESQCTTGRRLLVKYTYTSSLGSGLPGKDSCEFDIRNLVAI